MKNKNLNGATDILDQRALDATALNACSQLAKRSMDANKKIARTQ